MSIFGQSSNCETSDICREVLERTDRLYLAKAVSWLASNGLTILIVVFLAWLLARVVRKHVPRLVELYIGRQETDLAHATGDPSDETSRTDDESRADEERRVTQALRLERTHQRAATLGDVGGQVLSGLIWFIAFLMVLDQLGLNLAPLLAGAGVVGIALGFGAQQLVRDFLAGIFIIFEDQYGVGDVVTLVETTGTVERISLRTTKLRDLEGTAWFIPNGELKAVGNRSQLWARAVLDIEVGYDTDLEAAGATMKTVADELRGEKRSELAIIAEPEFWGVEHFGNNGVTIRMVVRTEPNDQWRVARELRHRIKLAFDDAGIQIPYPQREIWLHQPGPTTPVGG